MTIVSLLLVGVGSAMLLASKAMPDGDTTVEIGRGSGGRPTSGQRSTAECRARRPDLRSGLVC